MNFNEKNNHKECIKEAKCDMARQSKEAYLAETARRNQLAKEKAQNNISALEEQRSALIQKAVEVDKTDPRAAQVIVNGIEVFDKKLHDLRYILAMADNEEQIHNVRQLCADTIRLIRGIRTAVVEYPSGKTLEKIKKNNILNRIMAKHADRALEEELSIYTADYPSSDGNSAAKNDFLAAKRKALIEGIEE